VLGSGSIFENDLALREPPQECFFEGPVCVEEVCHSAHCSPEGRVDFHQGRSLRGSHEPEKELRKLLSPMARSPKFGHTPAMAAFQLVEPL